MPAIFNHPFECATQSVGQRQDADGARFGLEPGQCENFLRLPHGQNADMAGDTGKGRMINRQGSASGSL